MNIDGPDANISSDLEKLVLSDHDQPSQHEPETHTNSSSGSTTTGSFQGPYPPSWMAIALSTLTSRYRDDRLEVVLRNVQTSTTLEWRLKCLDCPGKLYTPGPGETLSNFEVHLRNRGHRHNVNERVQRLANVATSAVSSSTPNTGF
ncbi:hypothetical protein BJ165DRAFT_1404543 [Panaeolus papilionaceus]|nr:hypothetical protein BJ165DRAFT_1404543 [Panaeolus papilionaceus]